MKREMERQHGGRVKRAWSKQMEGEIEGGSEERGREGRKREEEREAENQEWDERREVVPVAMSLQDWKNKKEREGGRIREKEGER